MKIAYVGAGSFTNRFMFPQLKRHGVELAAICDLDEDRARAAVRDYAFAQPYTNYVAMLDEVQPDAVFCVGGPAVHYAVGKDVLSRGFPLYVQKSPAPSAAQTQELADVANGKDVPCHVGFNFRSADAIVKAKAIMADPGFGPPLLAIVRYGLIGGKRLRDGIMDQNCHAVDTLLHLLGKPVRIQAQWNTGGEHRSYGVTIGFESGAVGLVAGVNGQSTAKEFFYFEVTGPNQQFLTCHDMELVHRTTPGMPDQRYTKTGGYAFDRMDEFGYVADVASFLEAARGNGPSNCPVADTVQTMATCEAIYKQLRSQGAPE